MSTIVRDDGFGGDDWSDPVLALDELSQADTGVDLKSSDDPAALTGWLDGLAMIRVDFPSFSDGRGFTLARQLRQMGYAGRLRAKGHVLADQYAMARRSGFDEVEINTALADRQPEDQWLARADWKRNDYQSRLRG